MASRYKYIIRVEQPEKGTYCWQVRINYHKGPGSPDRATLTFSDNQHGGKQNALQAAIVYRDRCLRQLEKGTFKPRSRKPRGWGRGWSYYDKINNRGVRVRYVEAYYNDPELRQQISKRFGIPTYGTKTKAIKAAKAWRKEQLTQLEERQ